jgi:hypothetical protein
MKTACCDNCSRNVCAVPCPCHTSTSGDWEAEFDEEFIDYKSGFLLKNTVNYAGADDLKDFIRKTLLEERTKLVGLVEKLDKYDLIEEENASWLGVIENGDWLKREDVLSLLNQHE